MFHHAPTEEVNGFICEVRYNIAIVKIGEAVSEFFTFNLGRTVGAKR